MKWFLFHYQWLMLFLFIFSVIMSGKRKGGARKTKFQIYWREFVTSSSRDERKNSVTEIALDVTTSEREIRDMLVKELPQRSGKTGWEPFQQIMLHRYIYSILHEQPLICYCMMPNNFWRVLWRRKNFSIIKQLLKMDTIYDLTNTRSWEANAYWATTQTNEVDASERSYKNHS